MTWLSLINTVVSLLTTAVTWLHEQSLISTGQRLAAADAMTAAAAQLAVVKQVEAEADASAAKDSTDGAFDQSFERKD